MVYHHSRPHPPTISLIQNWAQLSHIGPFGPRRPDDEPKPKKKDPLFQWKDSYVERPDYERQFGRP